MRLDLVKKKVIKFYFIDVDLYFMVCICIYVDLKF